MDTSKIVKFMDIVSVTWRRSGPTVGKMDTPLAHVQRDIPLPQLISDSDSTCFYYMQLLAMCVISQTPELESVTCHVLHWPLQSAKFSQKSKLVVGCHWFQNEAFWEFRFGSQDPCS